MHLLLFKKHSWEGLTSGAITLTFRRWPKARVKPGGRYRCHPIGVLEVDAIELVAVSSITTADAVRAGFATRDALMAQLGDAGPLDGDTVVFRIELHFGGDGDRVAGALEASLDAAAVEHLRERLARFDAASDEAWTHKTLKLIDKYPRTAASKLASKLGRETAPFKADVVKLKKLGLTQSFEVGYELSPRGRAFFEAEASPRAAGHPRASRAAKRPR